MRYSLLLLMVVSASVGAQPPKNAQPLPDLPPPPKIQQDDSVLDPQVTIIKRGTTTIEEHRINGRLFRVKVTPAGGKPYYLVDYRGDGNFTRLDNLDSGVRPPQWVLKEF